MQVLPHAFPFRQILQQSPAAQTGVAAPTVSPSAIAIINIFNLRSPVRAGYNNPLQHGISAFAEIILTFSLC